MIFAATVLTLYPEMFPGPLGHSLAGRALAEGRWSLRAVQIGVRAGSSQLSRQGQGCIGRPNGDG